MWRSTVATAVLLALVVGGAMAQGKPDEQAKLYAAGKKAFAGCAACHFVSDPGIREDADWLKLNQVTACVSAGDLTAETRQALDVFLSSPETLRPLRVDQNFKPEEGLACAKIKVPATAGSAFLKAERESIRSGTPPKVRLHWQASQSGQTLTIPAGDYKVIGYRFYRPDAGTDVKEAKTWTISVTDVNGCADLSIAKDRETIFSFEPVMHGNLSVEAADEGVKLEFAIRNEKGSVLTLSRDGKMCLPEFLILDRTQKELYRGAFENT
jgi:hypothetical protein